MAKVIMAVGLPASGKSAWCQKYIFENPNFIYISSDEYRAKYFNDVNDQNHNTDIFKKMFEDTIEALHNNANVLYDATNINYKRRMAFVSEIKRLCDNVDCECVLFATPYEQCLKNNSARERKVPEEVIKKMYMNFTCPAYYEKWNSIHIVWWDNCAYDLNTYDSININQDNSHHALSLIEHCRKAEQLALEKYNTGNYSCLTRTVLLHDCGKKFVKAFHNYKGEPTIEAHYYCHEKVGAYESLFWNYDDFNDTVILYCSALIQWHMQPYFMKTEKSKNKFLKLVGQDFYDDIMILHECDELAH